MTSQSGFSIVANTKQVSALARDLRRASPLAYKAAQRSIRAVALVVRNQAAQNAAVYSTRIPGTGVVRMAGLNAKVRFGGDGAPDAAPIENEGAGFVRHPVFGNRDVWTTKNSHSAFLWPAFKGHQEEAAKAIEEAVYTAVDLAIRGV